MEPVPNRAPSAWDAAAAAEAMTEHSDKGHSYEGIDPNGIEFEHKHKRVPSKAYDSDFGCKVCDSLHSASMGEW